MKAEIKLIWQTAINLGFQFNETDAHEMWNEMREFQIKQNNNTIDITAEQYLESIGLENVVGEEFFNTEDNSYYKVSELMESYHKHKMGVKTKDIANLQALIYGVIVLNPTQMKLAIEEWERIIK